MYCNFCGRTMADDCLYCSACGRQLGARVVRRPLERAREGRKIAGVCMGFARHLDVDVTLVRLVWLVLALPSGGIGFFVFLFALLFFPPRTLFASLFPGMVMPKEAVIVPQAYAPPNQPGTSAS